MINELTKDMCNRGLEKLLVLFKEIPCMLCNPKFHLCVGNSPHTLHILQWQLAVQDLCTFFLPPPHVYNDWLCSVFTRTTRVFERRVMRRIFGPIKSRDGSWRIRTN